MVATPMMPNDAPMIPARIQHLRKNLLWLYRVWWGVHYAVGMIGIVAGAFAATASGDGSSMEMAGWGILAAVCTGLVTFLGPLQKAERYWRAFHRLDQACLEFEHGDKSFQSLIAEAKRVREILMTGVLPNDAHAGDSRKPSVSNDHPAGNRMNGARRAMATP